MQKRKAITTNQAFLGVSHSLWSLSSRPSFPITFYRSCASCSMFFPTMFFFLFLCSQTSLSLLCFLFLFRSYYTFFCTCVFSHRHYYIHLKMTDLDLEPDILDFSPIDNNNIHLNNTTPLARVLSDKHINPRIVKVKLLSTWNFTDPDI